MRDLEGREHELEHVESQPRYMTPPQAIVDLVDAKPTPEYAIDPTGAWMLFVERPEFVSTAELAGPELGLAGLRIDPRAFAPSRYRYGTELSLQRLADGRVHRVSGLPPDSRIGPCRWAPDGRHAACVVRSAMGLTLWVIDVPTAHARPLADLPLNGVLGAPFVWEPDSRSLLCLVLPKGRGEPPAPPAAPVGPIVQESDGTKAPARTYQDLLQTPHDAALFEYYACSDVTRVTLDGDVQSLGVSGLVRRAEPSPDRTVRQAPNFRSGKDSADGKAVLKAAHGAVCCCSMYCRITEIGAPPQLPAK